VLEDGPLELGGGGQVQPAGQGQHRHPILTGLLDLHGAAFISTAEGDHPPTQPS
jgi:hypothetical protein